MFKDNPDLLRKAALYLEKFAQLVFPDSDASDWE